MLRRLVVVAALCLSLVGCSDRTSPRSVFEPEPGAFTLSGRLTVVQTLTGELGDSLGVARIQNASGIRVRLLGPGGLRDSALSRDGAFEFHVDAPGDYRVACALFPAETLCTSEVTLVDADVAFPETLVFHHSPTVSTFPNPFPTAHGLAIEANLPTTQDVSVIVMSLSGQVVFEDLQANWPAGLFHYHWIGIDEGGQPAPNGLYWVCVGYGGAHHVEIVRKE